MNVICGAVITGKIIRGCAALGESEWGQCAALAHKATIHCFARPTDIPHRAPGQ